MSTKHYTAKLARQQMIEVQLRARGIRNERILQAMADTPREMFLPESLAGEAYEDRAVCIGFEQTISQPYIVAYMTDKLDVQPEHRVLEVGTGSGYQTAILCKLCAMVYSIESLAILSQRSRTILSKLSLGNVRCTVGDGTLGWPEESPFDRIMVTAGAPHIPPPLVEQLADGGKMILPIGAQKKQRLTVIEMKNSRYAEFPLLACRFVRLIGHRGWPGK